MDKEKIRSLPHLIAGLIVLVHGFENFEKGEFQSAACYLGLSILFMIVAGLHTKLRSKFFRTDTAFFLTEAITILYIAKHYKEAHHTFLFYLTATASVVFFAFTFWSLKSDDKHVNSGSKRKKRRRRNSSHHHSKPGTVEPGNGSEV